MPLNIKSKYLIMRCFSFLNWFKLNWYSVLKISLLKDRIKYRNGMFQFVLIIQIVSTIFMSCTTDKGYSFSSPEQAISEYQKFAQNLSQITDAETEELVMHICNWQELGDSVFKYISNDPSFDAHFHLTSEFLSVSDSIRTNIARLACCQNRSLKDIIYIKAKTSPYRNNDTIEYIKNEALTFYGQLSKTKIHKSTAQDALSDYDRFLKTQVKRNISTMDDFFRFLKFEDLFFRCFLQHLCEYRTMPLYDITANTEIVCKQIFESASLHELNSQDVVIYMAIRTNYRLILNALTCIDDIKAGRINEQEQLAAYQWMIIQPFLSIDGFSVAFLSDVQLYELEKIANEFTEIMHQLETNNANTILQCEELAKQILNIYIASL